MPLFSSILKGVFFQYHPNIDHSIAFLEQHWSTPSRITLIGEIATILPRPTYTEIVVEILENVGKIPTIIPPPTYNETVVEILDNVILVIYIGLNYQII